MLRDIERDKSWRLKFKKERSNRVTVSSQQKINSLLKILSNLLRYMFLVNLFLSVEKKMSEKDIKDKKEIKI
jgi:hypothetical protein